MKKFKLTGVEIIKEPRGLAVDSLREILYIVDGNGGAPILYAARIYHSKDGHVACEAPAKIAEGLTSVWVAVDFRGKVFFVVDNQIWSVPVSTITYKLDGTSAVDFLATDAAKTVAADAATEASAVSTDDSETSAEETEKTAEEKEKELAQKFGVGSMMVYDGGKVTGVSMPLGLAVDGYRMFWSNGENGKTDGTIVQGLENPMGSDTVTSLSTNLALAHGVCLTASRVYYTDVESNVFSTKTNGGPVTTVTDKLVKPRGCAFDGDGTVFVADQGANKILSFAGAAAELGPRRLSLALGPVQEPFGLAILHGNRDSLDSGASHSAAVFVAIAASLLSVFL